MKRRTKRDLTIFIGALIIIVSVALMNGQLSRRGMAVEFEKLREALEASELEKGDLLLEWRLMRETTGSLRSGGTFSEELLARDGDVVNIIGFMVPQEEFRDVKEFLLLPIPLECYFCSMPPARDVMLVQMADGESTSIYLEPVILNGLITVNQGPDQKFFYKMTEVTLGALDGGELTRKRLQLQHMLGGSEHPDDKSDLIEPSSAPRVSESGETD